MNRAKISWLAARMAFVVLALALAFSAAPVFAARDRIPPTTPTNLRVTGATSYSVSLAWNASTDNSGSFFYSICCGGTNSAKVNAPATSFTFTAGIEPGTSYSFRIFAQDAAGNKSRYSNTVTITTPPDKTPPTAPTLAVTDVGSTYVSLSWSGSVEDGPNIWYQIYTDGSPYLHVDGANTTSKTIVNLTPATAYTFSIQARDSRNNQSPLSNTASVMTEPSDSGDTTPPTMPGNLDGYGAENEEAALSWTQSTDNVDPQFAIRYEIFVNGDRHPESDVTGSGETIAFGVEGQLNTFEVVAVDSAGNRSAPASITICLAAFCN